MRKHNSIQKVGLMAAAIAFVTVGCSTTQVGSNGEPGAPVSVLSYSPLTQAKDLIKFPPEYNIRSVEFYTFYVPEPNIQVTADLPAFDETLPPGSVFVEAAGADRPAQVRRVMVHSPASR